LGRGCVIQRRFEIAAAFGVSASFLIMISLALTIKDSEQLALTVHHQPTE
jgi:hypothetical protein